jgi:hypothetical protein
MDTVGKFVGTLFMDNRVARREDLAKGIKKGDQQDEPHLQMLFEGEIFDTGTVLFDPVSRISVKNSLRWMSLAGRGGPSPLQRFLRSPLYDRRVFFKLVYGFLTGDFKKYQSRPRPGLPSNDNYIPTYRIFRPLVDLTAIDWDWPPNYLVDDLTQDTDW